MKKILKSALCLLKGKTEKSPLKPIKFLIRICKSMRARQQGMPVMVDFTGYGCVNCRKMEAAVWTDSKVGGIINDKYVLISLYVDDKTPLNEPLKVTENGTERTLRSVGDKWSYLQRVKFGANAQPFYVLLDNEGYPLNKSYAYNEDITSYIEFLQKGLEHYVK